MGRTTIQPAGFSALSPPVLLACQPLPLPNAPTTRKGAPSYTLSPCTLEKKAPTRPWNNNSGQLSLRCSDFAINTCENNAGKESCGTVDNGSTAGAGNGRLWGGDTGMLWVIIGAFSGDKTNDEILLILQAINL